MYLSFCQVLPINNTVPAGFCRVVDMELQNSKDASICAVVDRKLDNQTTSTFGQYLPQLVPFKTLQVGTFAFLVYTHTTVLIRWHSDDGCVEMVVAPTITVYLFPVINIRWEYKNPCSFWCLLIVDVLDRNVMLPCHEHITLAAQHA